MKFLGSVGTTPEAVRLSLSADDILSQKSYESWNVYTT